jgi:hypothetical protein
MAEVSIVIYNININGRVTTEYYKKNYQDEIVAHISI